MLYVRQGHFLGNFKKKFGFKRERAPFVLTPDYAFVMGGRGSEGTPALQPQSGLTHQMLTDLAHAPQDSHSSLHLLVAPTTFCASTPLYLCMHLPHV